ncbi:MAG: c-type cytochrome [Bdellovibrionales bacterium]|nr:c-type cytochrome [Bdellovibrionales bacterium]
MWRKIYPIIGLACLAACGGNTSKQTAQTETKPRPIGAMVEIKAPLGLPPVPLPADNPPTAETIALGRRLYYDTILSKDNTLSCASCHSPVMGFSDGNPVSTGIGKQKGGRNAPTVVNSAYSTVQFWDGRAPNLEEQAGGPMQNPIEMGHTIEGINKMLAENPSYKPEFDKAFGPGPVTFEKIKLAIATFERTVLNGNSPFDKYMYGGDKKALSKEAIRGLEVFKDPKKGNCAVCHTIEKDYALFTDNKFHNLGVGVNGKGELTDLGRYEVTKKEEDKGAFKTPTLRNIAKSGPYMHDGSLKTLKEVVDFYVGGGNSNQYRDKEIKSLDHLTKQEREDLVEFMKSLTGEFPYEVGPPPARSAVSGTRTEMAGVR